MSDFVRQHSSVCNFSPGNNWVILSPIEQSIKKKVEEIGTPLKEWDINIYRGILTGYNEAFIIDGKKKDELISKDPKSAEIIRPILRGRDIKRYGYDFADLWLINTHNGIKEKGIKPICIDDYPAIKIHLDKYYPELEKRQDKGDTPYNLRNCAYTEDFYRQKIVWARLMRISKKESDNFPRFSLLPENTYVADSLCFFTGKLEDMFFLQGVLNSEFAKHYFFNNIAVLDNGGMQMRQQYIELMPIPFVSESVKEKIIENVKNVNTKHNLIIENEINKLVYFAYGLDNEEINFIKQNIEKKINDITNSQ
jgi:hypothetical protein